jgi:hypothetical protein
MELLRVKAVVLKHPSVDEAGHEVPGHDTRRVQIFEIV